MLIRPIRRLRSLQGDVESTDESRATLLTSRIAVGHRIPISLGLSVVIAVVAACRSQSQPEHPVVRVSTAMPALTTSSTCSDWNSASKAAQKRFESTAHLSARWAQEALSSYSAHAQAYLDGFIGGECDRASAEGVNATLSQVLAGDFPYPARGSSAP